MKSKFEWDEEDIVIEKKSLKEFFRKLKNLIKKDIKCL